MLHCMSLYLVLLFICSLFSCDNSVKSEEKLFGDDCGFFFRIGTSSAVHLILGLLSSPIPLTSQSMISSGLMEELIIVRASLLHCCPDAFLTGHTSPHLAQPVFRGPEILLKMIYFEMYIPTLPFQCNALVFDDLTYLICNAHFCHAILFVASTQLVVVSLFCQPVYDHFHWVNFWCWTICLPWYPAFVLIEATSSTFL